MSETRKLSAIMFSDIQGYSRLMQKDEAMTLKLLEEHNALIFPIIEKHSGKIIKTVGDAILAVFDSCIAAVESAIEIQNALEEKASIDKKKLLRVRIGIHLGETVYKNNDVFGNGVNIAARLQPLADPGGICFSQSVFEQLQNHYGEKIIRVGPVNLKNISEPQVIYRMQIEGDTEVDKSSSIPMETAFIEGHSISAKPTGPDHERIEVFLGSYRRDGRWFVKKTMFLKTRFGAVELDFRDAVVEFPTIEVEVNAIFGAIEIIVPENFNVDISGKAIAGVFDGKASSGRTGPLLKITGKVIMGAVDVKCKPPKKYSESRE